MPLFVNMHNLSLDASFWVILFDLNVNVKAEKISRESLFEILTKHVLHINRKSW
jgi:hypothetical protein